MKKYFQFLKHFFRDPHKVGAVAASNKSVTKEITKYLSKTRKKTVNVLEVGAGYGNITNHILTLISGNDRLDIVEIDSKCCEYLREQFRDYPAVNIYCKSIQKWHPPYKYDYIISTIPFNSFSATFVKSVLDRYELLSEKGAICSYIEYAGLRKIRQSFARKEVKAMLNSRQELLDAFQMKYLFDKKLVFTNIPPCNVYHLRLKD